MAVPLSMGGTGKRYQVQHVWKISHAPCLYPGIQVAAEKLGIYTLGENLRTGKSLN